MPTLTIKRQKLKCPISFSLPYVPFRHRENLLRAENNRIGRIYHSLQIVQNGKIFCLWSDFHNKITKKVSSAHKVKENVTESFHVHRNTTKNELRNSQMVHNLVIFGWVAFFALKSIN